MNKKQMSLKISAVALAILLASCGGGGSEGYYNSGSSSGGSSGNGENGSTDPTTPVEETKELYGSFTASKTAMLISGDTVVLSAQVLDSDTGGAVANKPVTLQIVDAKKSGVSIDGLATQTTNSNGYAVYTVKLARSQNKDLLANGIVFNLLNAEKKKISDFKMSVVENESEKSQYDLFVQTNKNLLSVKGDNATITVKALDTNGGSLSNQMVTLTVLDYANNKVTIDGSSTKVTDELGNASFTVRLPFATGPLAANLIANGIGFEATIIDPKNVKVIKPLKLDVIQGNTVTPVGNITFGNAGMLSVNSEKTFYSEDISAQVVDIDGKPLPNQKVTMSINVISGAIGKYIAKSDLESLRSEDILSIDINKLNPLKWQLNSLNVSLTDLNGQLGLIDDQDPDAKAKKAAIQAKINSTNVEIQQTQNSIAELEETHNLIGRHIITSRTYLLCSAVTNPAVTSLATSLVDRNKADDSPVNEYSYTTGTTGSFDFKVNYLRRYAGWQTVQIKASTEVSGKVVESTMLYPLNALKSDLDADVGQPFDVSPYGSGICSYQKPWSNLL